MLKNKIDLPTVNIRWLVFSCSKLGSKWRILYIEKVKEVDYYS